MWGERTNGPAGIAGDDTFVFDTDTDFGDDTVWDAGLGYAAEGGADGAEVVDGADTGVDTLHFEGVDSLASLDTISTVTDDGTDVTATVYTSAAKTTESGSIVIKGIGDGSIDSFAEIDALAALEVTTAP